MSAASAFQASGPLPSATYAGWDAQTKQEPLWVSAGTAGGQNAAGPAGAVQFSDGAGIFEGTANATLDGTGVLTLAGDAIVGLNLSVGGTANIGGAATVGTDLIVANDVTASGNISCGNLTLSGNAVIAGNVGATNMTASGAVSGASLAVAGGATIGGSADVTSNLTVSGVGSIATVSSGFSFGSAAAPLIVSATGTFQFTNAGNKGWFKLAPAAAGATLTIKGNPNVPGQVPTTTFLDQPPGTLAITPSFDSPTGCWTITITVGLATPSNQNFYVVYS